MRHLVTCYVDVSVLHLTKLFLGTSTFIWDLCLYLSGPIKCNELSNYGGSRAPILYFISTSDYRTGVGPKLFWVCVVHKYLHDACIKSVAYYYVYIHQM